MVKSHAAAILVNTANDGSATVKNDTPVLPDGSVPAERLHCMTWWGGVNAFGSLATGA